MNMGGHIMRNRVFWVFLVAAISLAAGGLTTTVTSSYPGGTDLAATPCTITAKPVTIIKDPRIRFEGTVAYGKDGTEDVSKAPATVVIFSALPSGRRIKSVRLTGSIRYEFDVPRGTTQIGVQLRTGKTLDSTTRPPTRATTGVFPLDKQSSRTWYIPNANARAQQKPLY